MELRTVLEQLKSESGAGIEKTAGDNGTKKTSAAQEELLGALTKVLGATEKDPTTRGEKTAGADVTDELTKIATTLANADNEVMKKEAEMFGASVMDGLVARGVQLGVPLVSGEKIAAPAAPLKPVAPPASTAPPVPAAAPAASTEQQKQAEFEKWAATPEGQQATSAFQEGYKLAMVEINELQSTPEGQEKLASFRQGYADTVQQIEAIAKSAGGQEKLAALKKGIEDGVAETSEAEKLAQDTYARGYNDTVDLINEMRAA